MLAKTRFLATRAQSLETGFFPISSPVTKYARKNPVSEILGMAINRVFFENIDTAEDIAKNPVSLG
ncbi:MAG: hypothetical protein ACM65M_06460 [Microcoleus sp.]